MLLIYPDLLVVCLCIDWLEFRQMPFRSWNWHKGNGSLIVLGYIYRLSFYPPRVQSRDGLSVRTWCTYNGMFCCDNLSNSTCLSKTSVACFEQRRVCSTGSRIGTQHCLYQSGCVRFYHCPTSCTRHMIRRINSNRLLSVHRWMLIAKLYEHNNIWLCIYYYFSTGWNRAGSSGVLHLVAKTTMEKQYMCRSYDVTLGAQDNRGIVGHLQ